LKAITLHRQVAQVVVMMMMVLVLSQLKLSIKRRREAANLSQFLRLSLMMKMMNQRSASSEFQLQHAQPPLRQRRSQLHAQLLLVVKMLARRPERNPRKLLRRL